MFKIRFLSLLIVFSLLISLSPATLWSSETEVAAPLYRDHEHDSWYRDYHLNKIRQTLSAALVAEDIDEVRYFQLMKATDQLFEEISRAGDIRQSVTKEEIEQYVSEDYDNFVELVTEAGKYCDDPRLEISLIDYADRLMYSAGYYDGLENLSGQELFNRLHSLIDNQTSLGYRTARQKMFGDIDNRNGYVKCIYTGRMVKTDSIPDAGGSQQMNTEHTWPKSMGAGKEPAICDINHLQPTDTMTNNRRGNLPMGIVNNPIWERGGSKQGSNCFEPRDEAKGIVARSIFYFAVRYNMTMPQAQEKFLREWHEKFPPTEVDRQRNDGVFKHQGNRNPFIDHPEFLKRLGTISNIDVQWGSDSSSDYDYYPLDDEIQPFNDDPRLQ